MAQDFEDDARPAAIAPPAWSETMAQAALEAGLALDGDIPAAITRVAKRVGAWGEDETLAPAVRDLLLEGKIAFDAPLIRAALSAGAELAVSAALLKWPTDQRDELEAIARAQTLLAAGAKIGIAGAPSPAALDALDAAARLAAPGVNGAAILVRPEGDAANAIIADDGARLRASAALAAGARALDGALTELAIEAVRNGLNIEHGGVRRKAAAARLAGAPDGDIIAALAGAVARGAYSAALDAGADPSRRRLRIAAADASAHPLIAFAPGAIDPTGVASSTDECSVIAASIAIHRFWIEGAFDINAFEAAIRTLTRALDAAHGSHGASPRRPIAIRLEGLASLLMRAGLAYDSDQGRALATDIAALAHAVAIAESAALGAAKSAYPDWSRDKKAAEAAVKAARDAAATLSGPIAARAQATYRALPAAKNAGLRVAASIAFASDAATARALGVTAGGLAPLTGVAAYGVRDDGGFGRVLTEDARLGLIALGCDDNAIATLTQHIEGHRTLRNAPGVSLDALAAKGLTEPALEAIEEAAADAFNLRAAVHPLVIGPELCEEVLKLPPDVAAGKRGDLLMTLGFSEDEIAAAEAFCMGAGDFTLAPLDDAHAAVFASGHAIAPETRIAMAATVAPFARTALEITLTQTDLDRRSALLESAHAAGIALITIHAEAPPITLTFTQLEEEEDASWIAGVLAVSHVGR